VLRHDLVDHVLVRGDDGCLRAPASDKGRLRHVDGAPGRGHRRWRSFMLPTLTLSRRARWWAPRITA
jgi:hypothetical protein